MPEALILLAARFDETAVIYCLSELRRQGAAVTLISVFPGLVSSACGVTLRPDRSLSQCGKLKADNLQLLVLAGGAECAAAVLSDPRAHQLARRVLAGGGYVAAMSHTYGLMLDTGLLTPEWSERFIRQGERDTAVFVRQLIEQVLV